MPTSMSSKGRSTVKSALRHLAALLLALMLGLGLSTARAAEKKDKLPPSFKPGADVTLYITLNSPADWHLNDKVPIVFNFDEEELKKLPFSVEKTKWEFSIDKSTERFTALIPVKLSKKAPEGTVNIPLSVECSICTDETGSCAFAKRRLQGQAARRDQAKRRPQQQRARQRDQPFALPPLRAVLGRRPTQLPHCLATAARIFAHANGAKMTILVEEGRNSNHRRPGYLAACDLCAVCRAMAVRPGPALCAGCPPRRSSAPARS